MENIQKFDDLVARIFARLYQAFPVKINLTLADFGFDNSTVTPTSGFITIAYKDAENAKFFFDTVDWLNAAGYINMMADPHTPGRYAVLSSKGLEVLKATPASLTPDKSLGEYLAVNIKNGTSDAIRKGVSLALSMGTALAFHAATN
ncbi:hypothetical protein [Burkholderia gladioli]|uniref:hypothetical protein n=1 Tax=Burkholderia gladioli TaxID=28095 RepID=UPI0016415B02|nr:hypothetical protein [Burkholderia gladioli]MBJ9716426.1 hypothetical protein [Burkholderia gladioli]MDZ4036843.1 hypothetical protein [Burkholderia gladioli pv. alliicola]